MPSLNLTVSASTRVRVWNINAYRFRIEVTASDGIDSRVFIYQRGPVDPYRGIPVDYFCTVAGPVDMEELPGDAPNPEQNYPYYRLPYVELDVRTTASAEDLQKKILERVAVLVDAVSRLAQLQVIKEVQFGQPSGTGGSNSSSVPA